MFETLTNDILEQAETLVEVSKLDELLRQFLDESGSPQEGRTFSPFESACLALSPQRIPWRVYDHCAAITRLYSILDVFISDLVREVCLGYPKQVNPYSNLPKRVRKTHRVGFGKIILELEEKRYHSGLRQEELIATYGGALADVQPYKLIPEAFLVTKRALRLPQILEIAADLAIVDFEQQLVEHVHLHPYVSASQNHEDRRESIQELLNEFIDARNLAAHAKVDEVWSVERLRTAAYFIRDLALAMVDICERAFLRRDIDSGALIHVGRVTETFQKGLVAIVSIDHRNLRIGDELIIVTGEGFRIGFITSLQINDSTVEAVQAEAPIEVGLQLTTKLNEGNVLFTRKEITDLKPVEIPAAEEKEEDIADLEPDVLEEQ